MGLGKSTGENRPCFSRDFSEHLLCAVLLTGFSRARTQGRKQTQEQVHETEKYWGKVCVCERGGEVKRRGTKREGDWERQRDSVSAWG